MRKYFVFNIIILALLVFLFSCTASFSEEIRKPAVAGAFYPADKEELTRSINGFLDNAKKIDIDKRILAIITPHAGYVYSGQVAAYSYKQIQYKKINTAVIMCNSHTASFSGIAIDDSDAWQTPLGIVKVDKDLADKLVNSSPNIVYDSSVHKRDHTIEVQLPFLQTVLDGDLKIVPVLFGNSYDDSYKELATILAKNLGEHDIVIASTDMSHYPHYQDANVIDWETAQIIKQADVDKLNLYIKKVKDKKIPGEDTLCCGIDGVKTAIELYNILGGGDIEILRYANSGDVDIGDKSRVVGYISIVMSIPFDSEQKEEKVMSKEYLNKEEKRKLMEIARASVIEAVTGKKQETIVVTEERLKENCGAFVTLKKHGELRGCIGYIVAVKPLHETVKDVAKSAAVNDYRFLPVTEAELKDLEFEISALTPLTRIKGIDEIEVGKHGLVMKRGYDSGLLLPQVATEYGWDKETFLEHTSRKAGLSKDAWKDPSTEIYIFSAEVFGESDVK